MFQKIYVNYTHGRVEQFSQIKDKIESLRTAGCNITDELKNTTDNLETIIVSENVNLEEVKKIQFLVKQMTRSNAYVSTTMKKVVPLYLRSRNCFNGIRK